ncbi:hypothetical protein [Candidatus Liberibacter sp.]|nr:hypothetical protein [Candidatus Liberibacter sp.]
MSRNLKIEAMISWMNKDSGAKGGCGFEYFRFNNSHITNREL